MESDQLETGQRATGQRQSVSRTRRPITDLHVRRTRMGRGLFARRHYRPDEIIGEITGQVITDADYYSRYCFDLGDKSCLEPDAPFRFMNHCCQPNCHFRLADIDESASTGQSPGSVARSPRLFVLAWDTVRPNDELTIDYAWPPALAIPCRCGAAECRGWIVAADERHLVGTVALEA